MEYHQGQRDGSRSGIHSNTSVNLFQISTLHFMMSIKDNRKEAPKVQIMNHTITQLVGNCFREHLSSSDVQSCMALFPAVPTTKHQACTSCIFSSHLISGLQFMFTKTPQWNPTNYYPLIQNHSDHSMFSSKKTFMCMV